MTFKSLARRVVRFLGMGHDGFIPANQGAYKSTAKVGQGMDANVVMAPVQWIMRTFTQAEPIVERLRAGKWQRVMEHDAELLLKNPNPYYDGDSLTKALLLSWFLDGNAYLRKVRSALLRPAQLLYIPHWLIAPKWPLDGSQFISHYAFSPPGGRSDNIAPEEIIHLRFGLDPRNPRVGLSQLKAVMREVLTDEEASAFSAYILSNMGVPGGVISPKSHESVPSQDDVEDMKKYMGSEFSGERRGGWLVLGTPTEVNQFGFDPNRLQLGPLRDITEERVCAMLGLPAAVVGFGAGLQQTKVGATMRELVRLARVNCIEPTQITISRQLSRQLLPDFESRPDRARIVFDNSNISMFQEDETERAKRVTMLVSGGLLRVDRGQAILGLDVDETQQIYLRPTQSVAVKPGEEPDDDDVKTADGPGSPAGDPAPKDPAESQQQPPRFLVPSNGNGA